MQNPLQAKLAIESDNMEYCEAIVAGQLGEGIRRDYDDSLPGAEFKAWQGLYLRMGRPYDERGAVRYESIGEP